MSVPKLSDRITVLRTGTDGYYVLIENIYPHEVIQYAKRLVLLNSSIVDVGLVAVSRISMETARIIAQQFKNSGKPILSFIGHESTAKVLTEMLGVEVPFNRAMYKVTPQDLALVFRLKKRLEKPEDVKTVKPEDFDILALYYF